MGRGKQGVLQGVPPWASFVMCRALARLTVGKITWVAPHPLSPQTQDMAASQNRGTTRRILARQRKNTKQKIQRETEKLYK